MSDVILDDLSSKESRESLKLEMAKKEVKASRIICPSCLYPSMITDFCPKCKHTWNPDYSWMINREIATLGK